MATYLSSTNYQDKHMMEKCLICATGPSMEAFDDSMIPDDCVTIGVNAIYKYFIPNYLVVGDKIDPLQGHQDKCKGMLTSGYDVVFSIDADNDFESELVLYSVAALNTTPIEQAFRKDHLLGCVTTTEVAISLALYLGFEHIGLIGYDLKGHGAESQADHINRVLENFVEYGDANNQSIYNLSDISLVSAFKKIDCERFFEL